MRRPRGTKDLFGRELSAVKFVLGKIAETCRSYGYQEVETPIFEHLELFTKKSGANVMKQIYSFKDKSGRELALRPELTAPAVRMYIESMRSAPKPVKIWYSGSCFRYEEPQAQRWRQFIQAGVEVLGSARPEADAEVVALANDVMNAVGLKNAKIKIGNVRLLRDLLSQAGVTGEAQDPILRAVDSKDEQRISEELARAKVTKDFEKALRELISLKGGADVMKKAEKLLEDVPAGAKALESLRKITDLLGTLGVDDFSVDFGIARGLEYYTDFVFEIYADGVQVAGGGRYDELVKLLGGEPTHASGVGFGVDRIANALLSIGWAKHSGSPDCVVTFTEEKVLPNALELASKLRRQGFSVQLDLMNRKLRKALEYADSLGAEKVVIVGAEELLKGEVVLKNMRTGDQVSLPKDEVAEKLKLLP
ncbi:MAG: histidine--tRNA ligase [Candidatus Hadarchaeota archaeon]